MIGTLTRAMSSSKVVTTLGGVILSLGGALQAVGLDPWAHERYPWMSAAALVCTAIGTPLSTFGRGIGANDGRRAEDAPETNTAEMRAVPPKDDAA